MAILAIIVLIICETPICIYIKLKSIKKKKIDAIIHALVFEEKEILIDEIYKYASFKKDWTQPSYLMNYRLVGLYIIRNTTKSEHLIGAGYYIFKDAYEQYSSIPEIIRDVHKGDKFTLKILPMFNSGSYNLKNFYGRVVSEYSNGVSEPLAPS
ncbi:MAG: hypothetical protein Q4E88_02280 [Coriobacteriia bacterium]|nr:hypothetical protein [Coriobacteriia bacterium]